MHQSTSIEPIGFFFITGRLSLFLETLLSSCDVTKAIHRTIYFLSYKLLSLSSNSYAFYSHFFYITFLFFSSLYYPCSILSGPLGPMIWWVALERADPGTVSSIPFSEENEITCMDELARFFCTCSGKWERLERGENGPRVLVSWESIPISCCIYFAQRY